MKLVIERAMSRVAVMDDDPVMLREEIEAEEMANSGFRGPKKNQQRIDMSMISVRTRMVKMAASSIFMKPHEFCIFVISCRNNTSSSSIIYIKIYKYIYAEVGTVTAYYFCKYLTTFNVVHFIED